MKTRFFCGAILRGLQLCLAFLWIARNEAVIVISTGDTNYNTTAPTGTLAGSGWDLQGTWGSFLGTPISSSHFITAEHVGGSVGNIFVFQGVNYTTTGFFDDPNSDLRIWQVSGAFPTFAQRYTGSDETGKSLVVFGRGTQRGSEVVVSSQSKGWLWGTADGVQRWGENQVSGIINLGAGLGQGLQMNFNAGAGANEAHLSTGDSGGGVFIQEGGIWKLAAINYAVSGPYNTTDTGDGFNAALFDEGGLYKRSGSSWVFVNDSILDVPGQFYSTRISSNNTWIESVAVPEPAQAMPAAAAALLMAALLRKRLT